MFHDMDNTNLLSLSAATVTLRVVQARNRPNKSSMPL